MHSTVQDRVTEALRAKILCGESRPGEYLRQQELARKLSVSHIPVREALRQLKAEGLVDIEPHKGARVSYLSYRELRELLHLRQLLEPELLAKAIPNTTESDIASAETLLRLFGRNARRDLHAGLNWKFHAALLRPADSPLTLALVERLHVMGERYLRRARNLDFSIDEHKKILEFVRKRDVARAVALLKKHIGRVLDNVLIDKRDDAEPR